MLLVISTTDMQALCCVLLLLKIAGMFFWTSEIFCRKSAAGVCVLWFYWCTVSVCALLISVVFFPWFISSVCESLVLITLICNSVPSQMLLLFEHFMSKELTVGWAEIKNNQKMSCRELKCVVFTEGERDDGRASVTVAARTRREKCLMQHGLFESRRDPLLLHTHTDASGSCGSVAPSLTTSFKVRANTVSEEKSLWGHFLFP